VVAYLILRNFAWVHELGWYTPVITLFIYMLLWGGVVPTKRPYAIDPIMMVHQVASPYATLARFRHPY
jgi:hypothetical protein